jgi:hypothetical protein
MQTLFDTDSWFEYNVNGQRCIKPQGAAEQDSLELLPDACQKEGLDLQQCLKDAELGQQALANSVGGPDKWNVQPELGLGNKPVALVAEGQYAVNPGIKTDMERIEQKGVRYADEKGNPRYWKINDLSRMSITFDSVDALNDVLKKMLSSSSPTLLGHKVCWLHNRFRDQSAIGYCDINIGLHVDIGNGNYHIAEMQLHLMDLIRAKSSGGHHMYKVIRETLASWKVEKKDAGAMQELIVEHLGGTSGQAGKKALKELRNHSISMDQIINIMWQNQTEETVVIFGCNKLTSMIEAEPEKGIEACRAGASHPVKAAMQVHPQNEALQTIGKKLQDLLKDSERNMIAKLIQDMVEAEQNQGMTIFGMNIKRKQKRKIDAGAAMKMATMAMKGAGR